MRLGKTTFNLGRFAGKSLTAVLGLLAMGGAPVVAQAAVIASPLLGTSQDSKNAAYALADSIMQTTQGPINANNITQAIHEVVLNMQGYSTAQWAVAINHLDLSNHALAQAVDAVSVALDVPQDAIISSMLVDTFSTRGSATAQAQLSQLRVAMGGHVVARVLDASLPEIAQIDAASSQEPSLQQDIYNG